MKRSLITKFVSILLAVSLVIWSTGCSVNSVASDLWKSDGKAISVRTTDGGTYALDIWKADQFGNIEGHGRRFYPSGHPLRSGEYSGTIPVGTIESIQYRTLDDERKTEAIVVISAIVFFSLLSTLVVNDGVKVRALGTVN